VSEKVSGRGSFAKKLYLITRFHVHFNNFFCI